MCRSDHEIRDRSGADFVFNIHAAQTAQQSASNERLTLSQPLSPEIQTDATTATRFMRLHAATGPLRVSYAATIEIDHHVAEPDTLAEVPVRLLPLDVVPYIYPSRYCESDRLLKLGTTNSATCGKAIAACLPSSTGCKSGSPSPRTRRIRRPPRSIP